MAGSARRFDRSSRTPDLVATLGPATRGIACDRLVEAGATAFRLNASHLSIEEVEGHLGAVRRSAPDVPVVIDLQGAKMRLGELETRPVRAGDAVTFVRGDARSTELPLPHRELFEQVRPGDLLSADDDRVRFEVRSVEPGRLLAVTCGDGVVRARKGINVIDHPIRLRDLTDRDVALVTKLAQARPAVSWAVSFMQDGTEAEWVRRRAPGARVVGKIERREAAANVRDLAASVDELWVCRGDLGAQLGMRDMAAWVARFDPRAFGVPVLMAGQVLEHLTEHQHPTRSEVCHLYDLMARGYSGVVLSDETAIGRTPDRAIHVARELLDAQASGAA